jgi:tetratricopeptide (TPR) repeat protein
LLEKAERYALEAVRLDPNLPDAHLSLAAVYQMQARWPDAEAQYRRALELHPTFARANRWFGGMLIQFGRFEEGLSLSRLALELDPYDFPSQSAHGLYLFYAGRGVEAAAHLEQLLAQKNLLHARLILGQVNACLGASGDSAQRKDRLARALSESEELRKQESGIVSGTASTPVRTEYADVVAALAWSYYGDFNAARPYLARLEVNKAVSPAVVARVYAAQRRPIEALDALEAAEAQGDRELLYLAVSPFWERIRSEPRFQALVTRMHLAR